MSLQLWPFQSTRCITPPAADLVSSQIIPSLQNHVEFQRHTHQQQPPTGKQPAHRIWRSQPSQPSTNCTCMPAICFCTTINTQLSNLCTYSTNLNPPRPLHSKSIDSSLGAHIHPEDTCHPLTTLAKLHPRPKGKSVAQRPHRSCSAECRS